MTEKTGYQGFHPASDCYVVNDTYDLIKDQQPNPVLHINYARASSNDIHFNDARFTLIRSYEVFPTGEITPRVVFLTGMFNVNLVPGPGLSH